MKLNYKYILSILLLLSMVFATVSCSESQQEIEKTWTADYEKHLYDNFDMVKDVLITDELDTRHLSIHIICTDSKKQDDIMPVFDDFYNYIYNENLELRDKILNSNPNISVIFQLKGDVVIKFLSNSASMNKEKWSIFVNTKFDSYYIYGQIEGTATPTETA